MKRNLIIMVGLLAGITYANVSYAQQTDLVADQNPRYAESVNKYSKMADSLTRNQSATVQETYKAYDWYTAREERRQLRRERNYQLALNSGYYYGYNDYNSSWYSPNYGYYGSYFPSFGFRSRHWWFGF